MEFIGYHGTSETSAQNILKVGIQAEFLPETGQIGPGFYVAKMSGELPQWGAEQATAPAREKQWRLTRFISALTGDTYNPFSNNDARRTILKIYATRPLLKCKWNKMNPDDLKVLRAIQKAGGEWRPLEEEAMWLQMVIPPEELQYLRAERDDGVIQRAHNWRPKETPISWSPTGKGSPRV